METRDQLVINRGDRHPVIGMGTCISLQQRHSRDASDDSPLNLERPLPVLKTFRSNQTGAATTFYMCLTTLEHDDAPLHWVVTPYRFDLLTHTRVVYATQLIFDVRGQSLCE